MKTINTFYIVTVLLMVLATGCSGITTVTDAFTGPSAREVYARGFRGQEAIYQSWEKAYAAAVSDSLTVTLPYGEKGTFNPAQSLAYSYTVNLQLGEVLYAGVSRDSLTQRVFIEVFRSEGSGYEKAGSSSPGAAALRHVAQSTGSYKVVIQPEMGADSPFFISLAKKPLYAVFPVVGKGNGAIGSFWGMERDGGRRSHEGIDIFAGRGTPVIAVTGGMVTYTGERGLGGKQVWLRDPDFGSSLYYAHLDGFAVTQGQRVQAGDTLGYVGNTGNARFTPPHLHFGIYRSHGAIDPLPFVYDVPDISAKAFARTFTSPALRVKAVAANLRLGPGMAADRIGRLKANDVVTLLGQHNDWLHVQTAAGQKAFLHKSLVREMQ